MVFGRYILVGLAATAVHYLILFAMVELFGCPAALAAIAGATAGAFVAYGGNWHFTFARTGEHVSALPRFLSVAAAGVLINGAIVWMGTTQLGLHYLVAQVCATGLVVLMTYQINRTWTFT